MFERFKVMRRLTEIEERLSACERHLKAAQLDSDDLFDRLKRITSRVAKRDEREQNAGAPAETGESELTSTSSLSPQFASLTPRQKQIQMQIWKRRGNGA